jgi:double-stranded uracil-DNA glycosylase
MNPILPNVLTYNLKLVFCGTAPSRVSAQVGAYYGNPMNKFWHTLYAVGLIPIPLTPQEYTRLPEFGIGLTDMAKHAIGNDNDLKKSDFNREAFVKNITEYQPRMVAFTSKKAASIFLQRETHAIAYGLCEEMLGKTQFFVLTSPSGLARGYWDETFWSELSSLVRKIE